MSDPVWSKERAEMSFDRSLDEEDMIYIYTLKYYSAISKDEILPFVTTWMDLENIILSEISWSEKAKNRMITLMHTI